MGIELLPWQRWLGIHALELLPDDAPRFRTVIVLVARQNGKSTFLQLLSLFFLYVRGVRLVIGTAQNLDIAEEVWQGAVDIAQEVPELALEVADVVMVNGKKTLKLRQGERYKVQAASRRGGRGLSGDLVLLDELREHQTWAGWSAVTKTTMARPSPQVLGFSSAGDQSSVVLASLREKALAAAADRTSSLGIEWSAPDGCALDDRAAWAQANPALGYRMTEEALAAALAVDPEDVFRTEVLSQWVTTLDPAIPPAVWAALVDPGAPRGTGPVFALDVAPDQSSATIAVAWRRSDGGTQVMLADHRPGVEWVVARAAELTRTWRGRLIVEGTGTAAFLLPTLEQAGATVETVTRRFFVDACAALDAAVTARSVRHGGQAELNAAVAVARWSTAGDAGQRVLSRKDPRVSPLVAATFALHAITIPAPSRGGWMVGLP